MFVEWHCANGNSQIKGIDFDQSYSPVAHADSFRINIAIIYMHRLTSRVLDVSNAFQNTNLPIHEIVCVISPPYYLDLFERSYPNVHLNLDDDPFFFNVWIYFKEQSHMEYNGIECLMHWSQLLGIRRAEDFLLFSRKVMISVILVSIKSLSLPLFDNSFMYWNRSLVGDKISPDIILSFWGLRILLWKSSSFSPFLKDRVARSDWTSPFIPPRWGSC